MKPVIFFIVLFLFTHVFAQNTFEVGVSYGNSELFRINSESFYDYTNAEFGVFGAKNLAWKSNATENFLLKFWVVQTNLHYAKYEFLSDNEQQDIFKINALAGIKLSKNFNNKYLSFKALLGSGYNSGYHQRLEKGIYFSEQIMVGVEFPVQEDVSSFLNIGFKHVSNANIYALNRGAEVAFIQFGIQFP